jgi:hypothetical protein
MKSNNLTSLRRVLGASAIAEHASWMDKPSIDLKGTINFAPLLFGLGLLTGGGIWGKIALYRNQEVYTQIKRIQ